MATAHVKYTTISMAASKIHHFKCEKLRGHLNALLALTCLSWITEFRSVGYESGYFKNGTLDLMEDAVKILLKRIRPQIIPIVENIVQFSDNSLMSAIGNSYGDVYETQLEWAKNSRMNQTEHNIPKGHKEFILPIL